MRLPKRPPDLGKIINDIMSGGRHEVLLHVFGRVAASHGDERYLPWDGLRWRTPPDGLTAEEWWATVKIARHGMQRLLPLRDATGRQFTYALPDGVLRGIESIDKQTSGRISVPEPVTHDAPTRDRYVVNSLIEEAITSSQLEGAATTYQVAKDMLRTGRKPRTRDERMILNNYVAMRRVGEFRHERLTPALICEIHRAVTEDTLDNVELAGRIQLPGETRVVVEDYEGNVLHMPPLAGELPERLEQLCNFANGASDTAYVPPVVRAVVVHFMLAYDHPFVDGNGRTARALFYWSMLNQDYWLTEFISISSLIKKAPIKYARSFLYSEQDEGDLTYFISYQLEVIQRSIVDLHEYLERKVAETRELQRSLSSLTHKFNYRQLAVIEHALKNANAQYTITSHAGSHNVSAQTARTDLQGLEEQDFLTRIKSGRGFAWIPVEGIADRLR